MWPVVPLAWCANLCSDPRSGAGPRPRLPRRSPAGTNPLLTLAAAAATATTAGTLPAQPAASRHEPAPRQRSAKSAGPRPQPASRSAGALSRGRCTHSCWAKAPRARAARHRRTSHCRRQNGGGWTSRMRRTGRVGEATDVRSDLEARGKTPLPRTAPSWGWNETIARPKSYRIGCWFKARPARAEPVLLCRPLACCL